MDDQSILDLYFARSEDAIQQTQRKYGRFCYRIAYNILSSREDSEETVSDTYFTAWKVIPPRRPEIFSAFLMKITRNLAIDRWRKSSAEKRGAGEVTLALCELENCIPGGDTPEQCLEKKEFLRIYNGFLQALPVTERRVFLARYWHLESIDMIARKFGFSQSKVKTMLHRTRIKLRRRFEEEGF